MKRILSLNRNRIEFQKYLLSLLIFGSNGIVASFIDLSSQEIVFLRCLIGISFLASLFVLTKRSFTFLEHKKDLLFITMSGISMAIEWLLLFEAYKRLGVGLGMLINYTGPIIVVAFSLIFFKEKISSKKIIALIITFVGTLLISSNILDSGIESKGLICAILSAVFYASMVLFNKKSQNVKGMENSVIQLFVCTIVVIGFVGYKQNLIIDIKQSDILPILWLGAINTGFCCFLYFSSMVRLPVQTVAICGYLEPVSAVLFSYFVLSERMTHLQILGASLIILGAIYCEYKKRVVIDKSKS